MKQTTKTVGMGWIAVIIIAAILIVDQIIKIEVKTNMSLGEALRITDWFYIEFIENNGMAYGMTFINKLVLSLFRMFAICGIGWCIYGVWLSRVFSAKAISYVFLWYWLELLATLLTVYFMDSYSMLQHHSM